MQNLARLFLSSKYSKIVNKDVYMYKIIVSKFNLVIKPSAYKFIPRLNYNLVPAITIHKLLALAPFIVLVVLSFVLFIPKNIDNIEVQIRNCLSSLKILTKEFLTKIIGFHQFILYHFLEWFRFIYSIEKFMYWSKLIRIPFNIMLRRYRELIYR